MSSNKVEFEAKVAKFRRINIPKSLFQIKTGDQVKVRIIKVDEKDE